MEHTQPKSRPMSSRRDETTIAQSRPCGIGKAGGDHINPEGMADSLAFGRKCNGTFSRPFGTTASSDSSPNLERLGYSHSSLRDAACRLIILLSIFMMAFGLNAQDYVTNRLSLSGRVGFGISARFKGIAVLPVPTLNRATPAGDAYNYDDGYVLQDVSGNFGGQTWYWGYDNSANQVDAAGNIILLSRNSSASIGDSKSGDDP
jgi:hypothetical protein